MTWRTISRFGDVAILQQVLIKLAVEHLSELSSVACEELIVSYCRCDGGGHPEVVPLGGSLKSLAFMRECPKARSDKRVSGD